MSNTPNQPPSEKGPWLYSGVPQPTPAYTPPPNPQTSTPSAAPPPHAPSAGENSPPPALSETPIKNQKPPLENSDDASLASIVDTIEAIIIALILALTFRAFIIEAFVIPTGSMAPTLLGAHFKVVCPECGYTFDRDASLNYQVVKIGGRDILENFHNRGELMSNTNIPADGDDTSTAIICPNCQYLIPYNKTGLPQYLGNQVLDDTRPRVGRPRSIPFAWANNGDRILVLKYLYSILNPARFDVIVFKEPMHAQDNFIKRLIGLPGETVEIIGGDVYIGPPGKTDAADRAIARKPPFIQKDLWQLVYDNDYYPTDEGVWRPDAARDNQLPRYYDEWHNPWVGMGATAKSWNKPGAKTATGKPLETVGGPVIHYAGAAPGMLAFNPSHHDPYAFNDLGYNNDISDLHNGNGKTLRPVGDLRVETTWTPADDAAATLAVSVGLKQNLFRVRWSKTGLQLLRYDLATGQYQSVMTQPGISAPQAGKAHNIAMNNVDHSVQFFIDGKMVLNYDTVWNAADAYRDDDAIEAAIAQGTSTLMASLSPTVDVSVGGACSLGHLKVYRDLYYTQTESNQVRFPGAANRGFPLTLGKDEFFALGDNSRRSDDGRTWSTVFPALDDLGLRRGIVPRRYLLGKAVFVYWPAGFRFSDKLSVWPLVPNIGDMRFIR